MSTFWRTLASRPDVSNATMPSSTVILSASMRERARMVMADWVLSLGLAAGGYNLFWRAVWDNHARQSGHGLP